MLDARGLSCPAPVLLVQKAVKKDAPELLEVRVDDRCAVENISRFAKNHGYSAESEDCGSGEFLITLRKMP